MRRDFRTFRIDRISGLTILAETFSDEPGRTLQDYLERVEEDVRER
jgi:predicted DNA-binding transcriptional regulator YafY